jgi:hypothetical protein
MFNRKNKKINNREPNKVYCWSLITVLCFCLFSYGYLVRGVTVSIVARQAMESDLSSLNSKVITLESEYIKAKNSITGELAQNLGFIAASNQKFVSKTTNNPGLSLVTTGF